MWEVLAVVSTEDMALSCLGEAWQACADIWISEAVPPRESVPSVKLHRTDTCVAGRSEEWWPEQAPVFFWTTLRGNPGNGR